MSEAEVPPGPWRWVAADQAGGGVRGLVAADGTWVIAADIDAGTAGVHAAAERLLAKAHVLLRLPDVLELWEGYRDAETPVAQADALLQFANAMAHLGWDYRGELDDPADDVPAAGGSVLPPDTTGDGERS